MSIDYIRKDMGHIYKTNELNCKTSLLITPVAIFIEKLSHSTNVSITMGKVLEAETN